MKIKNSVVFFAPAPRTGSSLLSYILNQNNRIHSEGYSPLCDMLWSFNQSLDQDVIRNICVSSNRDMDTLKKDFFSSIMNDYYKNHEGKIILDKNSSWSLFANLELIKKYIDPDPRIIITRRNTYEMAASYVKVFLDNGFDQSFAEEHLLFNDGFGEGLLLRPLVGTAFAQLSKSKSFLFIDYEDIINNTEKTIDEVYSFLQINPFRHNLNKIEKSYQDNQNFVLNGLSEVRKDISKRKIEVSLSDKSIERIKDIDYILSLSKKNEISKKEKITILNFYNKSLSNFNGVDNF